jgi:acetoin utilization protein AcuC
MSNQKELCVLYGEELKAYGFEDPHPFGRKRLPAFWREFQNRGLDQLVAVERPEICKEEELLSFHTREYVDFVSNASLEGGGYLDYGDTPAYIGVYEAARLVVGTTLKAVRLVMEGKYKRAFCPQGGLHHARRERAGGFCVFSDVGVAIELLKLKYGLQRIGYVDIDAHHGDGVFYSYESDPAIFVADIHQDGRTLYPGTGFANEIGKNAAKGTKLNFPMPPAAGDQDFMEAFEEIESFIKANAPEIILLQCGADSAAGDPLAELQFSSKCHAHAARRLRQLADETASGRLIAMSGGGYDLQNLAHVWCEVAKELA